MLKLTKGVNHTKSDFRKFRLFCRLGIIVAILAVVAQACCVLFVGGTLGAAIGVTLLIVIGAVAAVLEWAAYDNLLCHLFLGIF